MERLLLASDAAREAGGPMLLKGLVEFVDKSNIRGWACLANEVDVHLQVKVVLDGTVVGVGLADEVREDLLKAGFGRGDHAFDIRIKHALAHDDLQRVEVLAVAPTGQEIRLNSREDGVAEVEIPVDPPDFAATPERLDVFPMPMVDTTQHPVFVLGAARSGTSAIAQALLKCGAYQGFHEGHFLWMVERFQETIRDFYAFNGEDATPQRFTMLSHAPYTYMDSAVRAAFIAAVAKMFPTGKWIDKTPRPQMIRVARIMQELWPNARFIFMKRRGIENVVSRLVKFGQISFQEHCRDWAASMEAWLVVRDLLGSAALEVEQLAVALTPDRVAKAIGEFLDLPSLAIERFANALEMDLPERTSDIQGPRVDIASMSWSVGQITEFRKICGPMMAAFGYGYTENYFAAPMPSITT